MDNGYFKKQRQTFFYPATPSTPEQYHYIDTIDENGKVIRQKVVDWPGSPAREAYSTEVEVDVFIPYTDENRPTPLEERVDNLETASDEIILMMADLIGGE